MGIFFQFLSFPTQTLSLSYQAYIESAHFDVGEEIGERAFLGSFHQGSGTIFSTVRHVDRGGLLPYKTIEYEGRVFQNDHQTAFVYEALLGEQCFANGGRELRYGPSAERLIATVDFSRKQVSLSISPLLNPFCGEEILPIT